MNSKTKISVLVPALQRWLYPWLFLFFIVWIDRMDGLLLRLREKVTVIEDII